jgi:hypothetical protein
VQGSQLTDQLGGPRVVRVSARIQAEDGDHLRGDLGPVDVQLPGGRVEQDPLGEVPVPVRHGVEVGEQRASEMVGGQHIAATAQDEGRLIAPAVHLAQAGPVRPTMCRRRSTGWLESWASLLLAA